jgi:hypothetical protein
LDTRFIINIKFEKPIGGKSSKEGENLPRRGKKTYPRYENLHNCQK